jgi:CRISPR-associated protein Cas5h
MPLANEKTGKKYHENGNFQKTIIKYNNSTGMASEETGGNLMVAEQTLIAPAFRCFVLLDVAIEDQKKLYNNILSCQAEYVPYLGKNECSLWWENPREHAYSEFKTDGVFKIDSVFIKQVPVKDSKVEELVFDLLMESQQGCTFTYFENLPVGYLGAPLYQYEYRSFAYTDWDLSLKKGQSGNLIQLTDTDKNEVVQLF